MGPLAEGGPPTSLHFWRGGALTPLSSNQRCSLFTVLCDFIIHGTEHVVNADAVSVYCVLALYIPPYIKLLPWSTSILKITFCVLLLTLPEEPTSTRCYIFIDRFFVLSSTMAALSMVLLENLTYVYWIRYRTTHCGYASVPSEPHLPQVCVFKPMNLHSTYGKEC